MNSKKNKYQDMSPFEVQNELILEAKKSFEKSRAKGKKYFILDAGRGDPNFLNTTVRKAFSYLSLFSISQTVGKTENFAFRPKKNDIAKNCITFLKNQKQDEAIKFLEKALHHCLDKLHLDLDTLVFEWVEAALGDRYPYPPRFLPCCENIVIHYLESILCHDKKLPPGKFFLFATEGATAAMFYIFTSLEENKILRPKDHIAIITPIFSPYLEIPVLKDYQLKEVFLETDEKSSWQLSDTELKKLEDPKIKALYLVNPANPTSVSIDEKVLEKIKKLVLTKRKDLLIITDTVYATFIKDFHSLVKEIPENVICVYSFSKYFGITGWRLGVILLHEKNIVDAKISKFRKKTQDFLNERYKVVSPKPEEIKFIDRLEVDSRQPALAHTGGLSTPQQCIMSLFALFHLFDEKNKYQNTIRDVLLDRMKTLCKTLDIDLPDRKNHTMYYCLINLKKLITDKYGKDFFEFMEENFTTIDYLFALAKERLTICLPGIGFSGPKWSIRVSLGNLNINEYRTIGQNILKTLDTYFENWKRKA